MYAKLHFNFPQHLNHIILEPWHKQARTLVVYPSHHPTPPHQCPQGWCATHIPNQPNTQNPKPPKHPPHCPTSKLQPKASEATLNPPHTFQGRHLKWRLSTQDIKSPLFEIPPDPIKSTPSACQQFQTDSGAAPEAVPVAAIKRPCRYSPGRLAPGGWRCSPPPHSFPPGPIIVAPVLPQQTPCHLSRPHSPPPPSHVPLSPINLSFPSWTTFRDAMFGNSPLFRVCFRQYLFVLVDFGGVRCKLMLDNVGFGYSDDLWVHFFSLFGSPVHHHTPIHQHIYSHIHIIFCPDCFCIQGKHTLPIWDKDWKIKGKPRVGVAVIYQSTPECMFPTGGPKLSAGSPSIRANV